MDKGSGVYKIIIGADFYIGATLYLHSRKLCHLSALKTSKHYSKLMQQRYDELGKDAFVFEVIEYGYDAIDKEKEYIKKYQPTMNKMFLNDVKGYKGEQK